MSVREEKSVDHPQAVIEKAQRLAQLLQRVEQGEVLAEVCVEIGVEVTPERLIALQGKYEAGGCSWEALIGRHGHEQKVTADMKEWLYERKRQDKTLTGPELVQAIRDKFGGVELSVGHINHLLRQVELSRQTGRPPKPVAEKETETVEISESVVDNAGLFFPGGS
jgi:transposase